MVGQRAEPAVPRRHRPQPEAAGHRRVRPAARRPGRLLARRAGRCRAGGRCCWSASRPAACPGRGPAPGSRPVPAVRPRRGAEPLGQARRRSRASALGAGPAERVQQRGPVPAPPVGVALHLASAIGGSADAAVVEPYGVAGVLPPLVGQAVAGWRRCTPRSRRRPGRRGRRASPAPPPGAAAARATSASGMPQRQASCSRLIHSGVASMVP